MRLEKLFKSTSVRDELDAVGSEFQAAEPA